jgi:intracellular septation protein
MKFLLDFFPILLFFIAYQVWDIYVATAVAVAAAALQVGWQRLRHGRVDKMQAITLGLLVVFGGLTLLFVLAQAPYLAKHMEPEAPAKEET